MNQHIIGFLSVLSILACVGVLCFIMFELGRKDYHQDLINELDTNRKTNAPILIYPDEVFGRLEIEIEEVD